MGLYANFGINYQATQSNWANDAAYFSKVGLEYIRINYAPLSNPWAQGTPGTTGTANIAAYFRLCAQTFVATGINVSYGPTGFGLAGGQMTATIWSQYRTALLAEAAYLQSIGLALWAFEIGNELEFQADGTTLTVSQLRANIRQLATDVKAVYTLSPITYGVSGNYAAGWVSDAILGGLDTLSYHPYGTVRNNGSGVVFTNIDSGLLASFVSTFGVRGYISEFNLDAGSANIPLLDSPGQVTAMKQLLATIQSSGIGQYFVFEWGGPLSGSNRWAMLNTNGSINPMWYTFFASDPAPYLPRTLTPNRSTTYY